MREILFKAKRIDNGEWVEGYYSTHPHPFSGFLKDFIFAPYYDKEKECGYDNGYQIDANTLCQYTGLTDKNGNKIWENDIVSFAHSKYIYDKTNGYPFNATLKKYNRNYSIEFTNTFANYGLRFRNKNIHFACKQSTICMHDVKVIGNIFDNAELLGG